MMNRLKEQINYSKFVETKSVILDLDYAERLLLELEEYHEKETPKKVLTPGELDSRGYYSWGYYCCPDCDKALYNPREDISWIGRNAKYCMECGRALDWGDENEK